MQFGCESGKDKPAPGSPEMELTNAALLKSQQLLEQFSDLNLGSESGRERSDSGADRCEAADAESVAQASSCADRVAHHDPAVDTVRVPVAFLMMMAEALAQQPQ